MDRDLKQLIKLANNAKNPSQEVTARTIKGAGDPRPTSLKKVANFIHSPLEDTPRRQKIISKGKLRRHKEQRAKNVKMGFGKAWSAEAVWFRVEFSWLDVDTEEETNEQVQWVSCRKLKGKDYRFYKAYFEDTDSYWEKGETVESKLVARYIAAWFIANRDDFHLNQAFIFPSTCKGNDTIRDPIMQVRWLGELPNYQLDKDMAIVLKKCIWHEY